MNIAISTLHVRKNYNPSQEVYVANLLKALGRGIPAGSKFFALVTPENRELFPLDAFEVVECPYISNVGKRIAWEQKELPGILANIGADLYHGTGNLAVFRFPGKQVVTVHYSPDYAATSLRVSILLASRKWMMGKSVRAADAVICASEFLGDCIQNIFGKRHTADGKIRIIPMGVDLDTFKPAPGDPADDDAILMKYGVKTPYLFAYCDILALKNESHIFRAWGQVMKHLEAPDRYYLALMGDPASEKTHATELSALGKHRDHVIFAGFVARNDLPAIYRRAAAFIYPSLVESFGLCILEAMACGTPVLTSNVTAMPEVAGRAALLVDPAVEEEIEKGMKEILFNGEKRKDLIADGLKRAAEMSWAATAEKTLALYREVLGEKA